MSSYLLTFLCIGVHDDLWRQKAGTSDAQAVPPEAAGCGDDVKQDTDHLGIDSESQLVGATLSMSELRLLVSALPQGCPTTNNPHETFQYRPGSMIAPRQPLTID